MNKPLPAPSFTLDPEHVPAELDQRDWYFREWLPNAQKALRGEPHDRELLAGGTEQANDDQNWDIKFGEGWE